MELRKRRALWYDVLHIFNQRFCYKFSDSVWVGLNGITKKTGLVWYDVLHISINDFAVNFLIPFGWA